jgi:hypothetical protein
MDMEERYKDVWMDGDQRKNESGQRPAEQRSGWTWTSGTKKVNGQRPAENEEEGK